MIAWIGGILTLMLAASKIWNDHHERRHFRGWSRLSWLQVSTPALIGLGVSLVFLIVPFAVVALLS